MRHLLLIALAALCAPLPALAQGTPPVPRERPATLEPVPAADGEDEADAPAADAATPVAADEAADGDTVPLPRGRPEAGADDATAPGAANSPPAAPAAGGLDAEEGVSTEDAAESEPAAPPRVYQTACPAVIMRLVEARTLPPIDGEGTCGEHSPLEVTGVLVNGRMVKLSSPATLTCEMASALPQWFAQIDGYVGARNNTRLERVEVSTSYMCRNVNNASSGRLSEHAFANGLDVMGFTLEDGTRINVESGWPGTEAQGSRILRHAHSSACSTFMTTLGPEANAEHRNHLHVDMGCHGGTCTARLCE